MLNCPNCGGIVYVTEMKGKEPSRSYSGLPESGRYDQTWTCHTCGHVVARKLHWEVSYEVLKEGTK